MQELSCCMFFNRDTQELAAVSKSCGAGVVYGAGGNIFTNGWRHPEFRLSCMAWQCPAGEQKVLRTCSSTAISAVGTRNERILKERLCWFPRLPSLFSIAFLTVGLWTWQRCVMSWYDMVVQDWKVIGRPKCLSEVVVSVCGLWFVWQSSYYFLTLITACLENGNSFVCPVVIIDLKDGFVIRSFHWLTYWNIKEVIIIFISSPMLFYLAGRGNHSDYALQVSELFWVLMLCSASFPSWTSMRAFDKSFVEVSTLLTFCPNRPINLWRNWRFAVPVSWGSLSHPFSDHTIHVLKEKKYSIGGLCPASCFLLPYRMLHLCISGVKFSHL